MNVKDYLKKVAYVDEMKICDQVSKVYKSKFDDSYITHVGMEDNIKHLATFEITEELTHGVGFSPKDNKWYGWSHRAIFGFNVGSTCKKGDCHYKGSNFKQLEEAAINFWTDDCHLNVRNAGVVVEDGEKYFDIVWNYSNSTPNENLRQTVSGSLHRVESFGRGEWVAKTMEDAKQMAVDFNEGVS